MIIAKPDIFTYIESILGAVVYLIGLAGSYFIALVNMNVRGNWMLHFWFVSNAEELFLR